MLIKISSIVIFHPIFIHKYHSFVKRGIMFFHVTKYYVLGVTKYS